MCAFRHGGRSRRDTMHDLIRIATRELASFLSTHLPTLGPQWWTTHVEEELTYTQQRWVRERGLTRLDQLDLAALLRIINRNWSELARTANLPREGQDWIREFQNMRNKWAHASTEQEAVEDTYRDADTLARCLRMLGAEAESIAAIETVKSTALREMAAASDVRAAPSQPLRVRQRRCRNVRCSIGATARERWRFETTCYGRSTSEETTH